ncbi:MAG TPA: DNA-formamidopyrimidine glycosylase family protein [Gaiellaceae bacterium]
MRVDGGNLVVMPEGDLIHRIARELQPPVGERVSIETPHPRARLLGLSRLGGKRIESIEALGKHLLLRCEGGLVLHSHLGMNGRWQLLRPGQAPLGTPWLVLHGEHCDAAQWRGPVLELSHGQPSLSLGPDILAQPFDLKRIITNLRSSVQERTIGEALLDQRLLAGIGNIWRCEGLWRARLSPWRPLTEIDDDDLQRLLKEVAEAMRESLAAGHGRYSVYRKAGRPCPRCGAAIRSQAQGERARTAYWCPTCQAD